MLVRRRTPTFFNQLVDNGVSGGVGSSSTSSLNKEPSVVADHLSRVFAALADPTRRDMVARLAGGDATVGELAGPYDVSVQAVSKHRAIPPTGPGALRAPGRRPRRAA